MSCLEAFKDDLTSAEELTVDYIMDRLTQLIELNKPEPEPEPEIPDMLDLARDFLENKENETPTSEVMTFGKFKGLTIKEIQATKPGKDYLGWLLRQQWCTEDKFGFIYEGCREFSIDRTIKKKVA